MQFIRSVKRPLLFVAVLMLVFSFLIVTYFPEIIYPGYNHDGAEMVITGRVIRIEEKSASREITLRSKRFMLLLVDNSNATSADSIRIGNTVSSRCIYKEFSKARNNGNFDEESYRRSLGYYRKYIITSFIVTDSHTFLIPEWLRRMRKSLKESVKNTFSGSEAAASGFITALLTGSRGEIDEEINDLYRAAGIAHILAISGLHISFVGMGLFRLARRFFRFGSSALIALSAAACYCIMTGGSSSAVRALIMLSVRLLAMCAGRKYDMLSSLSLASILLLASNPFYITNSGFQLSFAAIFGVSFVSDTLNKFLASDVRSKPASSGKRAPAVFSASVKKISDHIFPAFVTALSVTLTSLPFVIASYYEFPLYGVLLNMAVIPLMPYVLICSLAGGFAGLLSTGAARICFGPVVFITDIFTSLSNIALRLPFANICTGKPSIQKMVIYYGILAALLVFIYFRTHSSARDGYLSSGKADLPKDDYTKSDQNTRQISGAGKRTKPFLFPRKIILRRIIVFSLIALMLSGISIHSKPRGLQISFLDVDQGKCILVVNGGKSFMIDAGSTGITQVYRRRIRSALKYMGISRIDYMIVTHPDTDHISGLAEMLGGNISIPWMNNQANDSGSANAASSAVTGSANAASSAVTGSADPSAPDTFFFGSRPDIDIGCILMPVCEGDRNYETVRSLADDRGIKVIGLHKGMRIESGGITMTCLHPSADYNNEDMNEMSSVIRLDCGKFSALFTGDISSEVEKMLLEDQGISPDNTSGSKPVSETYSGETAVSCRSAASDRSTVSVHSAVSGRSAASDRSAVDVTLLDVAHHGSRFSSSRDFLDAASPSVSVISAGVNNSYGHPHPGTIGRLKDAGSDIYSTAQCGEIDIFVMPDNTLRISTKLGRGLY